MEGNQTAICKNSKVLFSCKNLPMPRANASVIWFPWRECSHWSMFGKKSKSLSHKPLNTIAPILCCQLSTQTSGLLLSHQFYFPVNCYQWRKTSTNGKNKWTVKSNTWRVWLIARACPISSAWSSEISHCYTNNVSLPVQMQYNSDHQIQWSKSCHFG